MITMLCGINGAGKSSYAAYVALQVMLNGKAAYKACKREFEALNANGFCYEIPPQRHLVYSDNSVYWGRKYCTYTLDGFRVGLSNPFFDVDFFPPYSTLILDEAQRYYDSRMSRYLRDDVYHWYQLHRHNDYNVYIVAQRPCAIDINIRALAQRVIIFLVTTVKQDGYGIVRSVTWTGREFSSADAAEDYLVARDKDNNYNAGKAFTATCDFNIFKHYNSKSCKPAFFAGHYNRPIDYYTEQGYQYILESFVDYNNNHYFTAPTGFWKSTEYDRKILSNLGVYNGD